MKTAIRNMLGAITLGWLAHALVGTALAKGSNTMTMDGSSKTVCIGHFLIDVPKSAKTAVSGSYRTISADLVNGSARFPQLKASVEGEARELRGAGMKRDAGSDALDRKFGVDPDKAYASTRLIDLQIDESIKQASIGYHEKASSDRFVAEVHRLIDGNHYRFRTHNFGADKYPAVRDSVTRAADRYVVLPKGSMPNQPGFCVGDGLFQEDGPTDVGGDATLVVKFPEYRNVTFTIDVSGIKQRPKESPLQDRIDGDLALLSRFSSQVNTMLRGKMQYAEQQGYEIGIGAPSEDEPGTRMHKFFWGAEGLPNDFRHPFMEVQLITGESGPASLTDEEAEALWKQLMGNLRLRPGS